MESDKFGSQLTRSFKPKLTPGMQTTSVLAYGLIFVFPIVAIVLGEVITKYATASWQSYFVKSVIYGGIGIILFTVICRTNSYAFKVLNLKPIFWGNSYSLFWGIGIGVLISVAAGAGYGISNGFSFQFNKLFLDFGSKLIGNLYPALTEEAYFRSGIVNMLSQMFGQTFGLASGSVPFGVIHVIGVFFGKTITFAQILGISLAGLMLSLVYLRFGLIGAASCHLMWNAFIPGWAKVYGAESKNMVSLIEGSWITCSLLLVACLFLYFSLPKST